MQNELALAEGTATTMDEGVVAIFQKDEYGKVHSVIVNRLDLERLLAVI